MPALGGKAGDKVFQEFQIFAQDFPMPHTSDAKAQLRARYLQMYADAGSVLFVFVQFLCTCNLFVCMHAQETRSSKKCRRQFVKKAPAIRECTRAVWFYSFAALNKNFSQDWAKRKRDSLDEPQRQAKAEKLKNFKEV